MAWETVDVVARSPGQELAAASAGTFMARVYRWMFGGLLLTAGVALYTATNPALFSLVAHSMVLLVVAELGVVFALSFLAHRISGTAAAALFLAYAALNGLTFSAIFFVYQLGSVVQVFGLTALIYGAMSLYGTVTRRDLSGWRTFLFMGLIGVVLASVVNIFLHSDAVSFVSSCAAVLVFAGLTAYDNQKLRALHASSGYSSALSLSIVGALTLYLDFINLFIALLRLFGRRRD